MRHDNSFTKVVAWERTTRILTVFLLILSGVQFLAAAIVYRALGTDEADRLIFAGSLLFAGLAFAFALAFWKSGAPTWKHKVVVAVVALPAALTLIMR
jgi:hypothetical protein